MEETRYTISDAAKIVNVESHVLRYWEDELSLNIPRNEMGHRYYTQNEIQTFCRIQSLKEKGFQLKGIKDILDIMCVSENDETNIISLEEVRQNQEEEKTLSISAEEKMRHFKYIMDAIVTQALQRNNQLLETSISEITTREIVEKLEQIERAREAREEIHFRKVDEALRSRQRGYSEAAMGKLPPYTPTKMNKRRFSWFHK